MADVLPPCRERIEAVRKIVDAKRQAPIFKRCRVSMKITWIAPLFWAGQVVNSPGMRILRIVSIMDAYAICLPGCRLLACSWSSVRSVFCHEGSGREGHVGDQAGFGARKSTSRFEVGSGLPGAIDGNGRRRARGR